MPLVNPAFTPPAVKANSELEFRFQKMTRVFLYLHVVHTVPPVLNLPLIVPELFAAACEHRLVRFASRLLARLSSRPMPLPMDSAGAAAAAVSALGRPAGGPSAALWGVAPSSYSLSKAASGAAGAASAAERLHMEAYLADQQSAEQSTVKGIATAARDATAAIVGDQGRSHDLLKEIRASLAVLQGLPQRDDTKSFSRSKSFSRVSPSFSRASPTIVRKKAFGRESSIDA